MQNAVSPETPSQVTRSTENSTSSVLLLPGRVVEVLRDLQDQLYVVFLESLATPQSKQLCRFEHVFDLAAVEGQGAGKIVDVGLADFMRQRADDMLLLDLIIGLFVTCRLFRRVCTTVGLSYIVLLEEVGPDGAARVHCELLVVNGDEDATLESWVERLHAVCCQDHVALEILLFKNKVSHIATFYL